MHPRIPLAFLATRAHYWLMVNLSFTRTPRSLSTELLSSRSAPKPVLVPGVVLPQVQDPALALVELHQVPLCPTLQPVQVSLMAAQPSGVSTTPPSLVSPADLLRVHSNSSSRSLMKKLNKTGPSTDPWGTPLVTGLQLDSAPLMTTL